MFISQLIQFINRDFLVISIKLPEKVRKVTVEQKRFILVFLVWINKKIPERTFPGPKQSSSDYTDLVKGNGKVRFPLRL